MTDSKEPTHIAHALKREGRRYGRWLEIGTARQEENGVIHVFLDRTPIGGFNGYVFLAPKGMQPESPERPAQASDGDGD